MHRHHSNESFLRRSARFLRKLKTMTPIFKQRETKIYFSLGGAPNYNTFAKVESAWNSAGVEFDEVEPSQVTWRRIMVMSGFFFQF